ncbi:hypothetical protein BC830DRAFT_1157184, partial [Chytriomyces sp. MP71]
MAVGCVTIRFFTTTLLCNPRTGTSASFASLLACIPSLLIRTPRARPDHLLPRFKCFQNRRYLWMLGIQHHCPGRCNRSKHSHPQTATQSRSVALCTQRQR